MEYTNDRNLLTKFEKRLKRILIGDAVFFIFGFIEIFKLESVDLNDNNQLFEIATILLSIFAFMLTAMTYAPKCTALLNLLKNKLIIDETKISGFQCENLRVKDSAT